MADFEEKTGMGLAQLMSTSAVFATTRALLWAGLKHQDRALTIEYVGQLMQDYVADKGGNVNELLEACMDAAVKQKAIPGLKKRGDGEGDEDPNEGLSPFRSGGTQTSPGPVGLSQQSEKPTDDSD
jgi:hypothetical protein